jgi:hypothetical protein
MPAQTTQEKLDKISKLCMGQNWRDIKQRVCTNCSASFSA